MRTATARRLSVLGFALACAVLAAVGWNSSRRLGELRNADRLVTQTVTALDEIDAIRVLLEEAESEQRGFVITGDPSRLEPYRRAVAALPRHLERLRQLAAVEPRQERRRWPRRHLHRHAARDDLDRRVMLSSRP